MRRSLLLIVLCVSLMLVIIPTSFAQKYNEAPMLAELVKEGKLLPVEERLPEEPFVVEPIEEVGRYGGTLRLGMVSASSWAEASQFTMEYIIMRDQRDMTKLVPSICESWEFSNEGKTFTLHFRKGLKWSDGHPFTADDILFWWEDVIMNDELNPVKPTKWRPGGELMNVEKVDDCTVNYHFAVPYYAAVYLFAQVAGHGSQGQCYMPKHALTQYHIKYNPEAQKLAEEAGYDTWWQLFQYKAQPTSTDSQQHPDIPVMGAWAIKELLPDGAIWERNPYYFKVDTAGNQLPYVDRLRGVMFRDAPTLLMLMTTGQIDFSNGWGTGIVDYPTLVKGAEAGGYQYRLAKDLWPSAGVYHFNHNYKENPALTEFLRNKKFRQALSLAIDREEIVKVVGLGNGVPYQATCNPDCSFYEERWSKAYTEYDPERANAMLDEIGLTERDAEGYRLLPNGEPLSLIVEQTEDMAYWVPINELVREYWADIGIRMAPKVVERSLYWTRLGAGEMQINLWVLDAFTEYCLIPNQMSNLRAWWWAPEWWAWWDTGGESGEEPPEKIKEMLSLCDQIPSLPPEEMRKVAKQILDMEAEELWMVGTIGFIGKPAIAKIGLGNVNNEAPGDAWDVCGSRAAWVEQIFWKE
jgi:peptide/nickel transport system substrate-binding protein